MKLNIKNELSSQLVSRFSQQYEIQIKIHTKY
jgi:hypothetical protein